MKAVREGAMLRYCFESFPSQGVIHGVYTRRGGTSGGPYASLNVGSTVGDDPAHVQANQQAIHRALGVSAESVVTARQVHGDRVAVASPQDGGEVFPETDALITNAPGLTLMLRFADCVPVFFYAPQRHAVGLAHAGWQGTLKGVAAKAAQAMCAAYGCQADELYAGLGPAIGPCCFEVGPEVLEAVRAASWGRDELISRSQADGKAHLDLWRANALQLREVGVQHIEVAGLCTCCHRHEFFSHRGEHGRTGRFAAVIGLS